RNEMVADSCSATKPSGVLLVLLSLAGQALLGPTVAHAQTDSSSSAQNSGSGLATGAPVRNVYDRLCAKCHGEDGTGTPARKLMPDIPDFTKPSWQRQRSDAKLLVGILEGKRQDMPSFGAKINKDRARDLVAYVRAFAPTKGKR